MRFVWAAWMCGWLGWHGVSAAQTVPRPGVQKMGALLIEINQSADPLDNPFRNHERAAMLKDFALRQTDPDRAWQVLPQLAQEQLRAGQPEAALESLRQFDQLSAQPGRELNPRQRLRLQHEQALCHLRLGERQNCLTNHTIESCLFPIGSLGVYQRQDGPRGAIAVLTNILSSNPHDARAGWLLNVAYMTLGEYPDKVPPSWRLAPRLFASDYDIRHFRDVSSGAGLDLAGWAGGCVLEDFDGDGFLDLLLSSWEINTQLRLFRNNGNGAFTERTREAGLTGLIGGLNMVHADYNNDGRPDVLVLRGAWLGAAGKYPCSLLRQDADGTFEDVTEAAGLLRFRPTQTAAWLDFDNDGWLDLFVGAESHGTNRFPCELYRNNGSGTFTECAAVAGVAVTEFVKGATAGDFDNDGRPDLYLSTRGGPNLLFRNAGRTGPAGDASAGWRFTNVAAAAGVAAPQFSFPTGFFDYDNDGWLDLLVTGYALEDIGDAALDYVGQPFRSEKARLYRNNRNGTFTDATRDARLFKLIHAMGLNFVDFDNDGWLDFLAGTGDPDFSTLLPNRAFRNAGGRFFQDVTTSGGLGHLQKGHAIVAGDLDHDGDEDIYEVIGGAYSDDTYRNALFENPGHGNHSLTLKLEGVKSNRGALGARIKVVAKTADGQRAIHRVVSTGASFGSSPLRQHIGLGRALGVERVEIFWPVTGQTQVLIGLEMNRAYTVREGDAEAKPWALRSFKLRPPDEKLCAPPGAVLPPPRRDSSRPASNAGPG